MSPSMAYLQQHLSLNMELTNSVRLAGQFRVLPGLTRPELESSARATASDLNPGPYDCVANT